MFSHTATEKKVLDELIAARQPNHGLPRAFYCEDLVYRADIEIFWRNGWLFAGYSCQIPEPGDFIVYDVDQDSIFLVRGDDGEIRAFHNVCRHRGTLICLEETGHVKRFICPYHQWTYDRAGQLIVWRGMQAEEDKIRLGLHPVHVQEVEGLLFICLAENPPDFEAARQAIAPYAKSQGFQRAKVAKILDFDIPANWKVVWENNRECYHCNVNHPQYIKANFDHYNSDDTTGRTAERLALVTERSKARWLALGLAVTREETGMTPFPDAENDIWYSANRTPLVESYVSETMDGKQVAPLMGDYSAAEDVGTLRIRMLPNLWNHSSCDYGFSTRLSPAGRTSTKARLTWLVDKDAVEGKDYHLEKLLPFWQLTSEQDWGLCAHVQKGINSMYYTPGPFSTYKEYNVDSYVKWYLRRLSEAINSSPGD